MASLSVMAVVHIQIPVCLPLTHCSRPRSFRRHSSAAISAGISDRREERLALIVPSRKDSNLIPCLAAVRAHEPGVNIIVVDDGLEAPPDCAIPGVKPFIFARNINIGIRAAGDDDVVLLNDDALLETPGGFTAMQRWAQEHPECGVIAPDSNVRRSALPYTIPFVCVLIPRTTIDRVGLLDERYDCYGGDDDDYCYRVRAAGLALTPFPACQVDHGSLQSTFRPDGKGLPIAMAQRIFRKIHGFEMATR